MKRYFIWGLAATILLAILLISCSDQSRVNNPQGGQSPSLAPLLKGAPGPQSVEGSYIVVMKENVLDVDHAINELSQRLSFKADYRYGYAIKGFAGKLAQSQIDELRKNPDVAYIEQDQIAHIVTVCTSSNLFGQNVS